MRTREVKEDPPAMVGVTPDSKVSGKWGPGIRQSVLIGSPVITPTTGG